LKQVAANKITVHDFIHRGTNSGGIVGKFLLDRYNDYVLRTTAQPVLLSKHSNENRHASYQRILVPVDFTEAGALAAHLAIRCFPLAQIVFLHAFQALDDPSKATGYSPSEVHARRLRAQESASARLKKFVDELGPFDNLVSQVVRYGPAFSVITNYASQMNADLIVLCTEGHPCLHELLYGSVASRFAARITGDVLAVPRRMTGQAASLAHQEAIEREYRRIMATLPSYSL